MTHFAEDWIDELKKYRIKKFLVKPKEWWADANYILLEHGAAAGKKTPVHYSSIYYFCKKILKAFRQFFLQLWTNSNSIVSILCIQWENTWLSQTQYRIILSLCINKRVLIIHFQFYILVECLDFLKNVYNALSCYRVYLFNLVQSRSWKEVTMTNDVNWANEKHTCFTSKSTLCECSFAKQRVSF